MIKYSLICDKEHAFEGWFSNSQDFDSQKHRNLVTCPYCDSSKISKTLMAPSISTSKAKRPDNIPANSSVENGTDKEAGKPDSDEAVVGTNANIPAAYNEMVEKMRELRNHIQANAENVGTKFPEEARKIHYGETEKRGIFGRASAEDVEELMEEGVEVMALPVLPEDSN